MLIAKAIEISKLIQFDLFCAFARTKKFVEWFM